MFLIHLVHIGCPEGEHAQQDRAACIRITFDIFMRQRESNPTRSIRQATQHTLSFNS
ncbi:hypothetical protein T09_2125 [Trichinella sp. T9]|nr:hypothetical protein T09_2125 [Trichinella sp. T9]